MLLCGTVEQNCTYLWNRRKSIIMELRHLPRTEAFAGEITLCKEECDRLERRIALMRRYGPSC